MLAATASIEVPTGDFSIDVPLPQPSSPPTDTRSFTPSFTTAIQAPSTMDMDRNKTPPPLRPYVRCPFTYEHKDQEILKLASIEQLAEHCESLRRKYADSTDSAVRSFIQLPNPDMIYHIAYSLDLEYQPVSPYRRILPTTSGNRHSPPTPSSRQDNKRSK